jgi:hypothetical protein
LASALQVPVAQAASGWLWYVVLGSFPVGGDASAQKRWQYVTEQCGLDAFWQPAGQVPGMNPNALFVYEGPFQQKSAASARLHAAKNCVPDAYIKQGGDTVGE